MSFPNVSLPTTLLALSKTSFVSANPKYGSEKRGPNQLLSGGRSQTHSCQLRVESVDVVLCCDPKAFTTPIHWKVSSRVDVWYGNREIPLRLPGNAFRKPTDNSSRTTRFGCSSFQVSISLARRPPGRISSCACREFLPGRLLRVSSFLQDNQISEDQFREIVRKQYDKKFGRFGEAVVESNVIVTQGFNLRKLSMERWTTPIPPAYVFRLLLL